MKKYVLLIVGIALITAGTINVNSIGKQGKEPKKNTLAWFAQQAKKERKNNAVIPAPIVEYIGTADGPDAVFSTYSLVVAKPLDEVTSALNDEEIVTWYKFKVIETVSQRPPCSGCPAVEPPESMPPLNEDEFLIAKYGGTLSVDGVNLTTEEAGFPPFSKDKSYLLFILKNPSGGATLWAGPDGAFVLNPDETVEPLNKNPHPVKDEIRARHGNSLPRLRQHVNTR